MYVTLELRHLSCTSRFASHEGDEGRNVLLQAGNYIFAFG